MHEKKSALLQAVMYNSVHHSKLGNQHGERGLTAVQHESLWGKRKKEREREINKKKHEKEEEFSQK